MSIGEQFRFAVAAVGISAPVEGEAAGPVAVAGRTYGGASLDVPSRPQDVVPQWYVAYTSANHERRVAQQLGLREIEHFLPQYDSVRKWKDRKVRLALPLFPGYVFVHLALRNRLAVLQVPGVACLVGFNGQPAAIPTEDLLRIRDFLSRGFAAEPHPLLRVGRRVRVTSGPLAGMEGIIVQRKNRTRLAISFEMIERAIAVEIGEPELEPLV